MEEEEEEEESLLRRAIAAIAISLSLSWSGLCERVFGVYETLFIWRRVGVSGLVGEVDL